VPDARSNSALNRRVIGPIVTFNRRVNQSCAAPCGRSISAARAGDSVRELIADRTVEMAIVSANC
jgi:hypothetical protein